MFTRFYLHGAQLGFKFGQALKIRFLIGLVLPDVSLLLLDLLMKRFGLVGFAREGVSCFFESGICHVLDVLQMLILFLEIRSYLSKMARFFDFALGQYLGVAKECFRFS